MTRRPLFRPMRYGAGFTPAGWPGLCVVAGVALLPAVASVLVFGLVAEPLVAAVLFMAAAGALAAGFVFLAQWLARGG